MPVTKPSFGRERLHELIAVHLTGRASASDP